MRVVPGRDISNSIEPTVSAVLTGVSDVSVEKTAHVDVLTASHTGTTNALDQTID